MTNIPTRKEMTTIHRTPTLNQTIIKNTAFPFGVTPLPSA